MRVRRNRRDRTGGGGGLGRYVVFFAWIAAVMGSQGERSAGTESEGSGASSQSSPSGDQSSEPSSSGGVDDWLKALREVAPYLDLGWRLAGSAAFPPLLGFLVDGWLGTTPWGVLVGGAIGLAAAVLQLKQLQEDLDR